MEPKNQQDSPVIQEQKVSVKKAIFMIASIIIVLTGAGLGVGYAMFWDKPVHEDPVDYQVDYAYNLVENNPKNPDLRVELAYTLAERGKLDEAKKELENALALDRNHLGAKLNLAIVSGEKGDMETARELLEDVAKESPKNEDAKFLLGQAYLELEEYKKAREQFEFILILNPGTVDYIYWIAKSYELEGNKEEAIKLYKQTVAYVPDYMPGLEALQALGVKDLPEVEIPNTPNHAEVKDAQKNKSKESK